MVGHFRNDRRILLWDLMNEPDNDNPGYQAVEIPNKAEVALQLIETEGKWARTARPSQPLTCGAWRSKWSGDAVLSGMQRFQPETQTSLRSVATNLRR